MSWLSSKIRMETACGSQNRRRSDRSLTQQAFGRHVAPGEVEHELDESFVGPLEDDERRALAAPEAGDRLDDARMRRAQIVLILGRELHHHPRMLDMDGREDLP